MPDTKHPRQVARLAPPRGARHHRRDRRGRRRRQRGARHDQLLLQRQHRLEPRRRVAAPSAARPLRPAHAQQQKEERPRQQALRADRLVPFERPAAGFGQHSAAALVTATGSNHPDRAGTRPATHRPGGTGRDPDASVDRRAPREPETESDGNNAAYRIGIRRRTADMAVVETLGERFASRSPKT